MCRMNPRATPAQRESLAQPGEPGALRADGGNGMTDTKMIDPCALASLTTGIVLCEDGFSKVHEAAEWLLGHPVWTHEFIDPDIKAALISAVAEQYPTISTEKPADWRARIAELRAEFGEAVKVRQGNRKRARGPVESLAQIIGDPA